MKVKVNIISMGCILMSEAVTVPSLTMMTLTVSEESLARDTHRHGIGTTLTFAVTYNFANKNTTFLLLSVYFFGRHHFYHSFMLTLSHIIL